MARQKTKLTDRFGSGGDKDGSPEEKFLITDVDIQIDPEWKVINLLRTQIDELTDVINANDSASGSYASGIKNLTIASSSLATNVNTLTSASSSFATGGGVQALGVTATSDAFPAVRITGFSHNYNAVSKKHSLVINVTVTDERGRGKLMTTTLNLA
tara:strand:- start:5038 stop:5508 length:471 start_codon:yes stop_codon:yes gene_type:complete